MPGLIAAAQEDLPRKKDGTLTKRMKDKLDSLIVPEGKP